MRNLKLFFVMAFLLLSAAVNAQLLFGVKAGVNASNIYGKDMEGGKALIGYHVGVTADFHFTPEMAVQSGLYWTAKGHADKDEKSSYARLNYLQVPIHFAYKIEVVPATRIVLHAGPYLAYGISGKSVYKDDGKKESEKITFGSDTFDIKPFDAGVGLGVDVEFGFLSVGLGYDMGLINMLNFKEVSMKNQNAYLSIGIRF